MLPPVPIFPIRRYGLWRDRKVQRSSNLSEVMSFHLLSQHWMHTTCQTFIYMALIKTAIPFYMADVVWKMLCRKKLSRKGKQSAGNGVSWQFQSKRTAKKSPLIMWELAGHKVRPAHHVLGRHRNSRGNRCRSSRPCRSSSVLLRVAENG